MPLAFIVLALGQLPGTTFASPTLVSHQDASLAMIAKRPVVSSAEPPPTLMPPPPTPTPAATASQQAQATPTATPKGGQYTVQPGDELKHIAAEYNVSIFKIIAANDIPNPDSLKIGQVLKIPEN
ncbi:MAG TPA: LysM domain-containing protein [Chloroflexota bacterium]|nr:LysM domain-containing protein [Chloroflexota bacterium]